MPTPSRCRPSGPRARLPLLLALAAAFLLVPVGQAAAEHGEPHLILNLVGEEGGGGEIVSPWETAGFGTGTPAIECSLPEGAGSEQEGVCENEMEELEPETLWAVTLDQVLEGGVGPALEGAPNSEFVKWEFASGIPIAECAEEPTTPHCTIASTGEEDAELTAIFKCKEGKECPGVPLTLKKTGTGKGTVDSSPEPDGIDCKLGCEEETKGFIEGSTVTLTAEPDGESVFEGWHGADAEAAGCDGTGATPTCEVVMSEAREVEAEFAELIPRTLTVEASGEGSVSATPPPAPLSGEISACEEGGGECSAEYGEGQTVTLEASPGAEKIVEWEGCDSEPNLTECEVAIPAEDATVKAEFVEAPTGTLRVEASGEGSVGAEEPPAPISGEISGCEEAAGQCSAEYLQGETVTLLATPGEHQQVAWTGCDAEPSANQCDVEVDAAELTVEADFTTITHELSVEATGEGSVDADSGAISACEEAGGACSGAYDEGSTVTLTATPGEHRETVWTSGCDNVPSANECEVTVEAAATVEVEFAQIVHTLTVNTAGGGSGSVSCDGGACAASYPEGAEVTLTASAASGSSFAGWSGGGCSGNGTCVVTIEAPTTVTASFDLEPEPEPTPTPTPTPTPSPTPTPAPVPMPALTPGTAIAKGIAPVKGNKALLRLSCRGGGACSGVVKLFAKLPGGKKARRSARKRGKARLVLIGRSHFSLPAGAAKTLRVRIANGKAKRLLRRGRALRARLKGAGIRNRTVVLKPARKKNKRAGRRRR